MRTSCKSALTDPTINCAKSLGPLLGWSVIWIDTIDGCFRCQRIAFRTRNCGAMAWIQPPGGQVFLEHTTKEKKTNCFHPTGTVREAGESAMPVQERLRSGNLDSPWPAS